MKKILFLAVIAILFSACNQHNNSTAGGEGTYTLTGKLIGLGNDTIFLVHRTDEATVIDTAVAKNDSFSFAGKCPQQRVYNLQWYRKNPGGEKPTKVVKEIFLENAPITVIGNADSVDKIAVIGSTPQKKYEEFLSQVKPFDQLMDSLENLANTLTGDKNKKTMDSLDAAYDLLTFQKKGAASDFIAQNRSSQVSSFVALRNFATEGASAGQLDSIFQQLDTTVQNGYYGRQLHDIVSSLKQTAVGMPAPPFTMNDTSGKPVSLADYKGKVVLIDFWASWCGPCRRENPNVVKAYRKYHPKGLEILAVSLDEKREKWIGAIVKDTLGWQHVSDLKGWNNAVAKQYAVRSIPNNYLVGKDGKIIAKTLYGDKLTGELEEVLK